MHLTESIAAFCALIIQFRTQCAHLTFAILQHPASTNPPAPAHPFPTPNFTSPIPAHSSPTPSLLFLISPFPTPPCPTPPPKLLPFS